MVKKKKKNNKRETVDRHFCMRCIQRLGYCPDEKEIIRKIQNAELRFYDRQSNRVTRWIWIDPITKTECIIPYDKDRKQIITVLFKDLMNGLV